VGIEISPSKPTSLWWTTLAECVSSTRMMSTGPAAPDSRDPLSCATTSPLDLLETRSGPSVGNQSRSSSGVARLLEGDPDSGTSSSMKSNAAPSETAEPVELGARSVLLPTTTRQYSSISSSLRGLHAQNSDHQRLRACSVSGLLTSNMRMTASAPRKNAEERDEKRSCPAVSYGRVSNGGRKESKRSG
jgi:hypothetical protein